MPKIDLNVKSKQLFGAYFPTVYVNRVLLHKTKDDETGLDVEDGDYEFDCYLTINFTKDEVIAGEEWPGVDEGVTHGDEPTADAIAHYIRNNLQDLYLYGFLSNYRTLNDAIDKKELNMQDVFTAFDTAESADRIELADFDVNHPSYIHVMANMMEMYAYGIKPEEDGGTPGGGYFYSGDRETLLDDYTPSQIYAIITSEYTSLTSMGSRAVYEDFWGFSHPDDILPNTTGPWTNPDDTDHTDCFLESYLYYTLALLSERGASLSDAPADWDAITAETNLLSYKIPLKDLVGSEIGEGIYTEPSEEWGSYVTTSGTRDIDGNEIFQIQNILLRFKIPYESDSGGHLYYQSRLEMIEKTYGFFTIGLDHDILNTTNHSLYNNNFGDIAYEHILEYNEVPNKEETIFVEAETEAPYYDVPLQTFDGKYFKPEPVAHQDIVDSIKGVIAEHSTAAISDSTLQANINNLETILQTKYNSHDLLPTLQLYRHTYTPKSTVTKSGAFYNDLSPLLNTLNGKVGIQTRLRKKIIYNTRVTDLRGSDYENLYIPGKPNFPYMFDDESSSTTPATGFVGPLYTGDPEGTGRPATPATMAYLGDEYIPRAWFKIQRESVCTYPSRGQGDFYEMLAESFGTHDRAGKIFSSIQYATMYEAGVTTYGEPDDTHMITWNEIVDIYRRNNTNVDVENPEGIRAPNDLFADYVVKNRGMFFFDWEKALHTQSNLSHLFDLSRLQMIMHLDVPYKYFRVKDVKLCRKEIHLGKSGGVASYNMGHESYTDHGWGFDSDPMTTDGYNEVVTQMTLYFDAGPDWPRGRHVVHACAGDWENETYRDANVYGFPFVYTFDNYTTEWYGDEMLATSQSTQEILGADGMPMSEAMAAHVGTAGSSGFSGAWLGMTSYEEAEGAEKVYTPVGDWTSMGGTEKERWKAWYGVGDDSEPDLNSVSPGVDDYSHWMYYNVKAIDEEMADLGHKDTSYIRMMNFDVMNSSELMLRNYNSYTGVANTNIDNGKKVKGGYRMMSFQFQDFMDDDVAYYNTYAHEYEDSPGSDLTTDTGADDDWLVRKNWLMANAFTGEPTTEYVIRVTVEDTTLKFFIEEMLTDLRSVFEKFMVEYYSRAQEVCSYNNVAEEYNQFFTDAIWALEGSDADTGLGVISEAGQACMLAIVYYNAYRELFYQCFSKKAKAESSATPEARTVELIKAENALMATKIMPPNGTLSQLEAFKHDFAQLINLAVPQGEWDESDLASVEGISSWGGTYDLRADGYTYHPIYDRMLSLCGWDADDDDGTDWDPGGTMDTVVGEATRYDAGVIHMLGNIIDNSHNLTFWNSIPIIDPEVKSGVKGTIAGDIQLANHLEFEIYQTTEEEEEQEFENEEVEQDGDTTDTGETGDGDVDDDDGGTGDGDGDGDIDWVDPNDPANWEDPVVEEELPTNTVNEFPWDEWNVEKKYIDDLVNDLSLDARQTDAFLTGVGTGITEQWRAAIEPSQISVLRLSEKLLRDKSMDIDNSLLTKGSTIRTLNDFALATVQFASAFRTWAADHPTYSERSFPAILQGRYARESRGAAGGRGGRRIVAYGSGRSRRR